MVPLKVPFGFHNRVPRKVKGNYTGEEFRVYRANPKTLNPCRNPLHSTKEGSPLNPKP